MLSFNTIAFGPVSTPEEVSIKNKLIDEIVFQGRKLARNPRWIVQNEAPTVAEQDRVVWQMKVVKPAEEGKQPSEIYFQVMETAADVSVWPRDRTVLSMKFDGLKRQLRLTKGSSENVYTLAIPWYAKPTCLRSIANQIVADLVVHDRAHAYLGSEKPKQSNGISHRQRYRRWRDRHDFS